MARTYPQSQWYDPFFCTKLDGRQKTIFTVGITQINVREKKQIAYLNLEGNLYTFSTFTFVEAFNKYLLNEWQVELFLNQIKRRGTSLVAHWLRICLPIQGTRVRSLVQEDPTYRGATKPMHHNYWACTLEPASHNYGEHPPQVVKPTCLQPVLRNKRSHHNEKPAHYNEE